jgi:hypothetical protein
MKFKKLGVFLLLLVVMIFIIIGIFWAIDKYNPSAKLEEQPADQKAVPRTRQPAQPTLNKNSLTNAITQSAVQGGVLSSAKSINQVTSYLTSKNQYGAYLYMPQEKPDESLFSSSLEIVLDDSSSAYASASFITIPGQNTEAVYDNVQYVPKSPEELRATIFKTIKNEHILKKNIIVLDAGNVKIFLMPAGQGCVVIKKQVLR